MYRSACICSRLWSETDSAVWHIQQLKEVWLKSTAVRSPTVAQLDQVDQADQWCQDLKAMFGIRGIKHIEQRTATVLSNAKVRTWRLQEGSDPTVIHAYVGQISFSVLVCAGPCIINVLCSCRHLHRYNRWHRQTDAFAKVRFPYQWVTTCHNAHNMNRADRIVFLSL